jgi:hypothetical protein
MFSFKPLTLADIQFTEATEDALRKEPYLGRKLASLARDLFEARVSARVQQGQLLDYYTDRAGGYKEGTANALLPSKEALKNPETPAGVLLIAARNVCGPGMEVYEPDTFRLEFEHEKIEVPPVNYDKLFAAITLKIAPLFYSEVLTFQNTVLAFNDILSDPEVVMEAAPAQIAWGVYEAELILQEEMEHSPDFDYEPVIYTATTLHRAGFIATPPLLDFAQSELTKMNHKTELTEAKVREAWGKLNKSTLASHAFPDDALGVQLAKIAATHVYVEDRANAYRESLQNVRAAST